MTANRKLIFVGMALFLAGGIVACALVVSAFKELEATMPAGDPSKNSVGIGNVLIPAAIALLGLLLAVIGIARNRHLAKPN